MTSRIGARIFPRDGSRLSHNLKDGFEALGVAQVSDTMGRLYGSRGLRPFHGNRRMAGVALTVKVPPGDNLMIHHALQTCEPGDVLVVDGSGCTANALVGEIMMIQARERGVSGFVIDGAIRDSDAFERADFACFAMATAHRGPYKYGPGEINVPVSVGGLVVQPGDLVIADCDGVLAIPPVMAADILEQARDKEKTEEVAVRKLLAGDMSKAWLAGALDRMNEDWK